MNTTPPSFPTEAVCNALGWSADTLDQLVASEELQSTLRDLCTIGTALRATSNSSPEFERQLMDALRAEGVRPRSTAGHESVVEMGTGLIAGRHVPAAFASIAAAFTTLFGLLATGARGGDSPLPILALALVAGVLVAYREFTDPKNGPVGVGAAAPRANPPVGRN